MGVAAAHPEDQICPFGEVVPEFGYQRVLCRVFGPPGGEEIAHRLGGGGGQSIQELQVESLGGKKAVAAPLRLAFIVRAQEIAGVVTEEVGEDGDGALDRGGNL